MSPEKLVYMANQIATFFVSQPHDEAVQGVADHINGFWEPRMRAQLLEILRSENNGLKPLVMEAHALIRPSRNDEHSRSANASDATPAR